MALRASARSDGQGTRWVLALLVGGAAALGFVCVASDAALYATLATISVLLGLIGFSTLAWMLYAWRTPETLADTGFPRSARAPRLSFSLIVPARHEETVLARTLSLLGALDHPRYEVIVVVGDDDEGTAAVARRVAAQHAGRPIRMLVDENVPKSKPKALNTALPFCRGDVVGVFDAEDLVAPGLLRQVDACFQITGAEIVQGATQLVNHDSNWYSVRNVLEYYFWFRSRLHFHAGQGFIPLGGNTVFVKRGWLERVGGWDPECLAEDCDLGTRLSAAGARTAVAYETRLATQEEAPHTLRAFTRQRTRWNQGYLQVLRKRDWRQLPPRPRALAAYTLSFPFTQAFMAIMLPISIALMALVSLPVPLALVTFLPAVPLLSVLAAEIVGLSEFCREYGRRASWLDYARLVLGALPFHFVLAFAAVRAALREGRGVRNWEKTEHSGVHLAPELAPDDSVATAA